ncbi:(S)-benzoin forming benzil reductase [Virgibacillus xinjiangensis]|uniref:(S)-benzoin forming benzil reductase n=1 Tax=Virgibacillus xinjiangensis TaxID=393090 RepID=A0ABV7CQY7_9BACI
MKYAVITGASKGLGESVAKLFLESGINVIGISRSKSSTLPKHAEENHVQYQHFSCDLANMDELTDTFEKIEEEIYTEDLHAVYLVNNAGVVEPIDQAMNVSGSDLVKHYQINTIAPMTLMNLFLKKSVEADVPLYGANVTSGAAERATYGWSAYSSSKASINMYTKTVALEQAELKTDNKVIAFSPGIMDTDMQEKIRTSSQDQFTAVDTFKNYKEKNLLRDTDAVGGVLVDILTDEGIRNGEIYNVKDYL